MADPENKDNPATPPAGNDDWKAKYDDLKKQYDDLQHDHGVLEQNRNLFKKQAEEATAKVQTLSEKNDGLTAELNELRSNQERTAKQEAAQKKADEVLSELKVSDKTKQLVKDLGIELSDAEDEDAVKAFTNKVEKISTAAPAGDEGGDKPAPKPKAPPTNSPNPRIDDQPAPKPKTDADELATLENKVKDVKF